MVAARSESVDVRRAMNAAMARLGTAIDYSTIVHERARFVARELSGRRSVGLYRPRGVDLRICVRHNYPRPGRESLDNFPLQEVFRDRCYEPPLPVRAKLADTSRAPRIVDLGAHLGYFSVFALSHYPDAYVLAFEPEPGHARLLRSCIAANRLGAQWQLIEAAAYTEDATLPFAASRSVASHISHLGGERDNVIEVVACDVFPHLKDVDLLKMDIEGGEWALLFDDRFGDVLPRSIVLEYHSGGCPGDNPKRTAVDRLTELGYRVVAPSSDETPDEGPFWGRGLLWAWRA
jgi:FkbM family methyltransferase